MFRPRLVLAGFKLAEDTIHFPRSYARRNPSAQVSRDICLRAHIWKDDTSYRSELLEADD